MSSYPLRYHNDVAKFLNILHQLIDIYQTEPPNFFKQCLENIPIEIYDKIIELNGSKTKSKYWSTNYMLCISLSKKIISALSCVEKTEYQEYHAKLLNHEHHYGNIIVPIHKISPINFPADYDTF